MYAVMVMMALFVVVVLARLFTVQVVRNGEFERAAKRQYESRHVLPPSRGPIFDRNGRKLASNQINVSYAADPNVIENAEAVADTLSRVFGRPKRDYLEKLRSKRSFVWLERRVTDEQAHQLNGWRPAGVIRQTEPLRAYRYGGVAGQVLGGVGIDNVGLGGVEMRYDRDLRGKDGYVVLQRNGLGKTVPTVDYPRVEATDGNGLVLTLDLSLQSIAEEELERGVTAAQAEAGIVIMLDPKTGEVRALSSYPSFDPNHPGAVAADARRNRAISDLLEPGSTFKVVMATAALAEGLHQPDDIVDAEGGTWRYSTKVMRDHELGTHQVSFRDAVAISSNVIAGKTAVALGKDKFYRYARDFGFGVQTGLDLPGEVRGILNLPVNWSGPTLPIMGMGYSVAVTPMQIACAYAAIANGGTLMQPFLVKQRLDTDGQVIEETQPRPIRRVMPPAVADTMKRILETVVDAGTGTKAQVDGLRIAGKTGTAQKLISGSYSHQSYMASFAGFYPVEQPEIVCVVIMDAPRVGGVYGGLQAAPIFSAIARRAMQAGLLTPPAPPVQLARSDTTRLPDLRALTVDQAKAMLSGSGLLVEPSATSGLIVGQMPGAGAAVLRGNTVRLTVASSVGKEMPKLIGLGLRRAVGLLATAGVRPTVQGSGEVVGQNPAAGVALRPGTKVTLICQPAAPPPTLTHTLVTVPRPVAPVPAAFDPNDKPAAVVQDADAPGAATVATPAAATKSAAPPKAAARSTAKTTAKPAAKQPAKPTPKSTARRRADR